MTGQYNYRARVYDAAIGRFTSQDPTGFGGEDMNLYRYCTNAPTDSVDPTGKQDTNGGSNGYKGLPIPADPGGNIMVSSGYWEVHQNIQNLGSVSVYVPSIPMPTIGRYLNGPVSEPNTNPLTWGWQLNANTHSGDWTLTGSATGTGIQNTTGWVSAGYQGNGASAAGSVGVNTGRGSVYVGATGTWTDKDVNLEASILYKGGTFAYQVVARTSEGYVGISNVPLNPADEFTTSQGVGSLLGNPSNNLLPVVSWGVKYGNQNDLINPIVCGSLGASAIDRTVSGC